MATAARVNEAGGEGRFAGDGASPPGRRHVVLRAVHQHRASPVAARRGVRRGERTQLSRLVLRVVDDFVVSRVGEDVDAVAGNLTVDGNGTLGRDCTPSVKDGDVATWYVEVLDGREVTKPGVRFTDAAGASLSCRNPPVVPRRPAAAGVQTGRAPSPCAGTTDDPRVGDGVCHPSLNVAPCFDGGDCCEETCAGAACGTERRRVRVRRSRRRSPSTGLPAPGAWATYNAAIAAAWTLAPAWKVELTLDAAAMSVGDGLITGEVCCMRVPGANSDPLGADFD